MGPLYPVEEALGRIGAKSDYSCRINSLLGLFPLGNRGAALFLVARDINFEVNSRLNNELC